MSVSNHYTCAVIDVESVKSMDQVEFEVLITEIGRGSANAADVWNSAVIVNRLAVSRVIQDYKWPPHFYDSLWTALNLCWQEATALIIKENMSIIWKIESSIWSTLKILFKLPEFDAKVAADSCFINADTVQTLFRRVLVDSDLVSAQQCIHWIYQHRSDLRPLMRRSLCTTLLSERVSTFGARKSRQKDGGDGRDHVGSLLGVLITIIEGLSCFSQTVHINLLTHVLMPLHQPNEMVDWREQIPVLQMYHTPLVRCLKVLIEKSRMKHDLADSISRYKQHDGQLKRFSDHPKLSVPVPVSVMSCVPRPISIPLTVSVIEVEGEKGRRSSSVLPAVIKSLNKYWPSPQAANTPKEVLMLHELEELVAMSCPVPSSSTAPSSSSADSLLSPSSSDIAEILQIFLERIVLSLGRGGNSDNFRTVQRALQVFKNKAILQLLGSSGAIVSNTSNDNETRGTDPHLYHSSLAPDDLSILQLAFTALIPALYRGGNLSWNPTVNKMTVLALRNLRDLDPDLFKTYANHLLTAGEKTGYGDTASLGVNTAQTAKENDGEMARESSSWNGAAHLLLQQISSQPYANKKMKPPVPVPVPSRNPGHQATSDPQSVSTSRIVSSDGVVSYQAGITRNAPWATLSPVILNKSNPSSIHKTDGQSCDSGSSADSSGSLAAQVRITSVAARAIPHIISQKFSTSTSMPQPGALSPYRGPGREDREENSFALHSFAREEMGKGEGVSSQCGGYIRLLEYMEKCLPTQPEGGDAKHDHEHDWKALQAAPIPTLLPSLRFHDLVFGRELGKGSFGTVKYARMIVRGKPQSEWPEYAVKIVSGDTLLNKGYSWATAREMAVLQTIAHPGFARMISSFKYTHSAYMVLEYASGGDLHSQVVRSFQRRGPMSFPLSHLCTRFILGEVASALLSLHQMDLSFNDLKPENILITGKGHVKIADFGACRALTPSSWEKLETESKRLLSGDALRNGDWKDPGPDILEVCCVGYRDGNFGDTDVVTDIRLEGTPAYMPPEMLRGEGSGDHGPGYQDFSDAWALGCVASFCLRGRPLYIGSRDEVLRQLAREEQEQLALVQFDLISTTEGALEGTACGSVAESVAELEEAASISFISSLLNRDPIGRLSLIEAVAHPYLTTGTMSLLEHESPLLMDPLTLHLSTPPVALLTRDSYESPNSNGNSGSACFEDHLWARRQFSVLWAPMPANFTSTTEILHDAVPNQGDCPYSMDPVFETDLEMRSPFWP